MKTSMNTDTGAFKASLLTRTMITLYFMSFCNFPQESTCCNAFEISYFFSLALGRNLPGVPHLAGLGLAASLGVLSCCVGLTLSLLLPPGDHDGPPPEDHLLHCRHWQHRRADGSSSDAPLQLPRERGGLPPVPGWEEAVQDDLPCLRV